MGKTFPSDESLKTGSSRNYDAFVVVVVVMEVEEKVMEEKVVKEKVVVGAVEETD